MCVQYYLPHKCVCTVPTTPPQVCVQYPPPLHNCVCVSTHHPSTSVCIQYPQQVCVYSPHHPFTSVCVVLSPQVCVYIPPPPSICVYTVSHPPKCVCVCVCVYSTTSPTSVGVYTILLPTNVCVRYSLPVCTYLPTTRDLDGLGCVKVVSVDLGHANKGQHPAEKSKCTQSMRYTSVSTTYSKSGH